MEVRGHYLNNSAVAGTSARVAALFDPATGAQHASVALADAADAARAVHAAAQAWPAWAALTPLARARILFRFRELMLAHLDELAGIISLEHGKVFADARAEIQRGLEVVEFACGIPHLLKGEHSLGVGSNIDSYTLHQSLGVCVGISPFNFPVMVPLWMFPIALACGNTFIMKPSELDPSASLFMADLLRQAGAPPGVFNVLNGDRATVEALIADTRVQAVSFVGSTPVAESVYRLAAQRGIRAQALGGAKNHLLVMPDADLAQVTTALLGAAYGSAGERCMAISVAVCVDDASADALVQSLGKGIAALTVGPGMQQQPEPQMGPLVSQAHAAKVRAYIDGGVDDGATLVCDGRGFVCKGHEHGYFIGPTLFDHVTPGMRIYREEIFGPVLCIVRARNYDDALALINAHEYGNGTAIFTRNGRAARRFCEAVQAGMVGVNVPIPVPMAFHSFGGWKRSLFGPLHMHGPEGVRFFTRLKTITARWHESEAGGAGFAMPVLK